MSKNLQSVMKALGSEVLAYSGSLNTPVSQASTDSRDVSQGTLFFALSGERFDGHEFVESAHCNGATVAVVSHKVDSPIAQIVVKDVGLAYGAYAKAYRQTIKAPLVAICGSNGKTTTTQMMASLGQVRWPDRVCVTQGNFNNEVGVPRTLLSIEKSSRLAVVEAGMNHPAEMGRLADWIRPDIVILTNAQREHQAFLSSVEMTAYENGMMIVAMPQEGTVIYPADDACASIWLSLARARGVRTMSYATSSSVEADVKAEQKGDRWQMNYLNQSFDFVPSIQGEHNLHNLAGVVAAGLVLGMNKKQLQHACENFKALTGRGEKHSLLSGRLTLIDESYNANPDSVKAALKNLAAMPHPQTFVFGDMGEVGENVTLVHQEVGQYARDLGIDRVLASGEMGKIVVDAFGQEGVHFASKEELIDKILSLAQDGGTISVKASHAMGYEKIVQAIKNI